MSVTISTINMKGGVGKSTLTVNLAWYLAMYHAKKVLVVDLDPQFNASQYMLGHRKYRKILEAGKPTVWELFEQNSLSPAGKVGPYKPSDFVQCVDRYGIGSRIDLIPSRLELSFAIRNPAEKFRLLPEVLSDLDDRYDLILIDCAPTESVLTTAAYLSSDLLLIPVRPEFLSSIGVSLINKTLDRFQEEYGFHDLEVAGIVFNAVSDYSPEEDLAMAEVREVADRNGWYIFRSHVPFSKSFPKGAREGEPILTTSYARSGTIVKFNSFGREFLERIGVCQTQVPIS